MTNDLPDLYWGSVASSADGQTLVAVAPVGAGGAGPGGIFSTTNSGISWTTNNVSLFGAVGVASSADGKKMFVVGAEQFLRSTNSGTTWTKDTNAPIVYSVVSPSQYVASSADGNRLVLAVTASGFGTPPQIYISTNGGDAWNLSSTLTNELDYVASSANGNILVGVSFGSGPIFVSTNSGTAWTTNNSPTNQQWGAVACSADGGKLVAAAGYYPATGPIYLSQSVQPPLAGIIGGNGNVTVSWLVPSTNFVLLQSPDLSSWTNVTNAPELNTNSVQEYVTLASTNKARFYRLKLQ